MKQIKIYGYQELDKLTPDELLTVYNRIAERVNKRITRTKGATGAGYQASVKRMPVIRSAKGRNAFIESAKQSGTSKARRDVINMVLESQTTSQKVKTKSELAAAREEATKKLKVLVGQSYKAYHHDEAYYSKWVYKLTDEELQRFEMLRDMLSTKYETPESYIYRIEEIFYNTGYTINPIRSFDDLEVLFENAFEVLDMEFPKKPEPEPAGEPEPVDNRIKDIVRWDNV